MEQLVINFRTLAGVSTSYNIVIGADNNAQQVTKIITSEDFERYRKLEREHGKKKKKKGKRSKKKKDVVILEIDDPLTDSRDYAILQSPATLKRQSVELAAAIEEGRKKIGDNNEAISYGFAKIEGTEKEFMEKRKEAADADYL